MSALLTFRGQATWQRNCLLGVVALLVAGSLTDAVQAQRGGGGGRRGGFGVTSYVQLTTLAEVRKELALTDAQEAKAKAISDALAEERSALGGRGGGGGGGDFAARAEKLNKLNSDAAEKLMAAIDAKQWDRLTEIFVQVNGATALTDAHIAKKLGVTEEQTKKLTDVTTAARDDLRAAFQDLQGASAEERTEKMAKLNQARDEKLLAVLDAGQKEKFAGMKGKTLEIDMSQLRGFGRGGRGGN